MLFEHLPLRVLLMAATIGLSSDIWAQRRESQRVEPIRTASIRALTKDAQSAARGDKDEFVLGLDARFRARWGDFESFPISLVKRDDLRIVLSSPYMTYRRTLAEYLRINRPVADVPWVGSMVILVEPSRIDAPDITRIVVEREGQPIGPVENLVRPMTFTNGNGGEAVIHAGEIRFPVVAFMPGATVTITAVPATGAPFVTTLDDAQLRILK